ncbi:MAG: hypothetical protein SPiTSB_28020 [Shewanella algae]
MLCVGLLAWMQGVVRSKWLVLYKKHNIADRFVSNALRGFHSNRLSALSDFDRPRHAFSQMP